MPTDVIHVFESPSTGFQPVLLSLGSLPDALGQFGVRCVLAPRLESTEAVGIVHIHGWGYPQALEAANLARGRKIRYIISPHGKLRRGTSQRPWWRRFIGGVENRRLVENAVAVTALNAVELEKLRGLLPSANTCILSYGLPLSTHASQDVQTTGSGNGRCWMTLVDSLEQPTGTVALLKVLAELGQEAKDWNVRVVGERETANRLALEAAMVRKGASDRVRFELATDGSQVASWIRESTLVASPQGDVTFPIAIMQAVSLGVPALASRGALFEGGEAVVPVLNGSSDGLRRLLPEVLRDSVEKRDEFRRRSLEVARTQLDWLVRAPDFVKLYALK